MCVTLNPVIKIAPIHARSVVISYLLKNKAKKYTKSSFVERNAQAERQTEVSFDKPTSRHKQELVSLLPPPPPKKHKIQVSLFISLWKLNQTHFPTP